VADTTCDPRGETHDGDASVAVEIDFQFGRIGPAGDVVEDLARLGRVKD
jgi:hypothetical protein